MLQVAAELDPPSRAWRQRGVRAPTEIAGTAVVQRVAGAIDVVERQPRRIEALRDGEPRRGREPPCQARQPGLTVDARLVVEAQIVGSLGEGGPAQHGEELNLVRWREVVDQLRFEIAEAEREPATILDALQ